MKRDKRIMTQFTKWIALIVGFFTIVTIQAGSMVKSEVNMKTIEANREMIIDNIKNDKMRDLNISKNADTDTVIKVELAKLTTDVKYLILMIEEIRDGK